MTANHGTQNGDDKRSTEIKVGGKKLFDEDRVFFYGLDVSSFTDPDSNEHARMSILSLLTKCSWKVK